MNDSEEFIRFRYSFLPGEGSKDPAKDDRDHPVDFTITLLARKSNNELKLN